MKQQKAALGPPFHFFLLKLKSVVIQSEAKDPYNLHDRRHPRAFALA
jgi:hypothetical protein